ncbi:hypothetical protein KR067_000510 [Drosophila pandora]|nr:hypothetical protein KR067_000510 [Drosophila pandora]
MDCELPESLPSCRAAGLSPKEAPVPVIVEGKPKFIGKKKEVAEIRLKNELFHCDADGLANLEEQSGEVGDSTEWTTPRWFQLDEIQKELSGLKLRVSHLNGKFRLGVPKCPDIESCTDIGLEARNIDTHPDILDLQRNSQKLVQQQAQLEQVKRASDQAITLLKNSISQSMCFANSMQGSFGKLDCFERNLEWDQALCVQRYRSLNHRKLSNDFSNLNNSVTFEMEEPCALKLSLEKLITIKEYTGKKKLATQVIFQLKSGAINLLDCMNMRIHTLDDRLYYPDRHQTLMSFIERNSTLFTASERHSSTRVQDLTDYMRRNSSFFENRTENHERKKSLKNKF